VKNLVTRLTGRLAAAAALLAASGGPALAATASADRPLGQPEDWQLGLQPAATDIMAQVTGFNSFTLWLITAVTLLVLVLLVVVIVRFNARAHPEPTTTSHNTLVEVIWTAAPILILLVIAIPSFRLLYNQLTIPEADITVKVTGYQWFWGYEYMDGQDVQLQSVMLRDEQRTDPVNQPRLLAVNYPLVVPVDAVVRLQITAADVLHAWALPAFGVKIDAVPGRLNETWFQAEIPGIYFGQCSELCGQPSTNGNQPTAGHAFMPIEVRVVTQEQYDAWVAAAPDGLDAAYRALTETIQAEAAAPVTTAAAPIAEQQT